jgi:WD40 repeat protein
MEDSGWANSVGFSPDGKMLASGGQYYGIRLWEASSRKLLRTFTGHSDWVNSVSFGANGKVLASGNSDSTIVLWDVAGINEPRILVGHSGQVNSVAFSYDGKVLASGSDDHTIKLWDIASRKELWTLTGGSQPLECVSYSPDGKVLAIGSGDSTIILWDIGSGKELRTFTGFFHGDHGITFSPAERALASGGTDGRIKLWDIEGGRGPRTFVGHSWGAHSFSFSPDGSLLASWNSDSMITLWDVRSGEELRTFSGDSKWIGCVSFSPDGKIMAIGCGDSLIKLCKVDSGRIYRTLSGHGPFTYSVSFSPDGKLLARGGADSAIDVWDVGSGRKLRTLIGHLNWVMSVSFSPDRKIMASGSLDHSAKLWDVGSGKELLTLIGHSACVSSVSFSPDGKSLATGSWDGTLKLWDVRSGRQLVSFIPMGSTDWVVTTPENYYLCSKGGLKGVAFRLGNRAFPFEQFDLKLNRPDIVLKTIGYASDQLIESYHKAYEKRLKRMDFKEDMLGDDFHVPEISIVTRNLPLSTTEKFVTFKVRAEDSKYRLDRLNVYVNDVPIYGTNGINLRDKNISSITQDLNVVLSNGKNKIQVSVLNENRIESLKETFEIEYTGAEVKPDLYLIAIGISKYVDTTYNLTFADKDASDIAQFMKNQQTRFGRVKEFRVLNGDATKERILAIKDSLMQSHVDDEVFMFYAGHGLVDDSLDYYLATTDIDFEHPARKGLPYDALEGILDGIPAREKVLLIDACHSGEIDKEETNLVTPQDRDRSKLPRGVKRHSFPRTAGSVTPHHLGLKGSIELVQELFSDLRRGSGAVVISAASGDDYAYEDEEWNNGAFTYALLEGIRTKKADTNQDGEFTVSELRDYVIDKVQSLTDGEQKPTSRRENLDFDFRIF